jgi:hypoxanthine phosphoribosyltransferase
MSIEHFCDRMASEDRRRIGSAMEILFDNCRPLITSEEIQGRVMELARRISNDYAGKDPLLIVLLKGGFIFLADLVRNLTIPCEVEFVTASSYREGAQRSVEVEIDVNIKSNLSGREIIIVDGIVDTGHTLSNLMRELSARGVESCRVCTLLDKPSARQVKAEVHYVGFEIPDVFAVGYGLDFMEQYRNLSYIAELSNTRSDISITRRLVKRPDFAPTTAEPVTPTASPSCGEDAEKRHR